MSREDDFDSIFTSVTKKSGESIADFVAQLRCLATNCKFGAHLDDAMCDDFVCGLHNDTKEAITWEGPHYAMTKAVELALSLQSIEKMSQSMHSTRLHLLWFLLIFTLSHLQFFALK